MTSVLRDWVMELPLREQGTLLTAYRGCDVLPKDPLDSTSRTLTAHLRWLVGTPCDEREVDYEPGCFMQSAPPASWRASELGHLPLHFYSHLMHAYEVVAYRHPSGGWPPVRPSDWEATTGRGVPIVDSLAANALTVYRKLVHGLHLEMESRDTMIRRLSEDRVASGTVVS